MMSALKPPPIEIQVQNLVRAGYGIDDIRVMAGITYVSIWALLESHFGRDHPWTRIARRRCGCRL